MKYSYEQRLQIVSRVKTGEAIAHLSKEYHINKTQILAWIRMRDKYGRSGLEKQPHCRPTPELKEQVVRLILEKGIPLSHIRIDYRIGNTTLQRWVAIVEALLSTKQRGRPPKTQWQDRRRKSPRPNLKGFKRRNSV